MLPPIPATLLITASVLLLTARAVQALVTRHPGTFRTRPAVWLRENPHTWRATVCAGALLLLATATLVTAARHDVPDPTPVFGGATLGTAAVTAAQARTALRVRTRAVAAAPDGSQAGARTAVDVGQSAAARAASLFVGAFNIVYEDDVWMLLTLHKSDGVRVTATGVRSGDRTVGWEERFEPAEVAAFLTALTTAILRDPGAVLAVTSRLHVGSDLTGWAWKITDGRPLDADTAARLFHSNVDLRGPQEPHVTLSGPLDTSPEGLSATALTDDVKETVTAHGAH